MGIGVLCTALAMVLPRHDLEPFLLMLSSIFIPLYGVILGRMGCGKVLKDEKMVKISAAAIWLLGIGVFHASTQFTPEYGSTLPSLMLTFALAWLTREKA